MSLDKDPDLKALEDFWRAVADECARRPFSLRMLAQARLVRLSSRSMQAMFAAEYTLRVALTSLMTADRTDRIDRLLDASRFYLMARRALYGLEPGQ